LVEALFFLSCIRVLKNANVYHTFARLLLTLPSTPPDAFYATISMSPAQPNLPQITSNIRFRPLLRLSPLPRFFRTPVFYPVFGSADRLSFRLCASFFFLIFRSSTFSVNAVVFQDVCQFFMDLLTPLPSVSFLSNSQFFLSPFPHPQSLISTPPPLFLPFFRSLAPVRIFVCWRACSVYLPALRLLL